MNDIMPSPRNPAPKEQFKKEELNQRILQEICTLYFGPSAHSASTLVDAQPKHSLACIADRSDIKLSYVSTKAIVLVIGNISAGKSTFINWYAKEALQKTGMAIETNGFTVVSSGKMLNEFGGESTVMLYPFLQEIVQSKVGLLENLSTKTCPSSSGRLQLLNLIDSPGLMDGTIPHPFDVEGVICDLAAHVDLVLAFFEPIGQALGSRMLNVIKRIYDQWPEKLRFCLSKVDVIKTEAERIKILCQTTQSLTTEIRTQFGFDLIPMYIPGAQNGSYLLFSSATTDKIGDMKEKIVNRLEDIVQDMEKIVEIRVQITVKNAKKDCEKLSKLTEKYIRKDNIDHQRNSSIRIRRTRQTAVEVVLITAFLIWMGLHLISYFSSGSTGFLHAAMTHPYLFFPKNLSFLILNGSVGFLPVYVALSILLFTSFYRKSFLKEVRCFSIKERSALYEDACFLNEALTRCNYLNHCYLENEMVQ